MKSSLSLESPDWKKMVSNNWIFDVNKCVIALLLQLQHISRDFRLGNSLHYLYAMWKCSCLYSAWEMTFTQYFIIWNLAIQGNLRLWKRGGFDYIQELLKLLLHLQKKVGQAENGKCHFPFWMQENNTWNTPQKILKRSQFQTSLLV